jgi:hypothetical protein
MMTIDRIAFGVGGEAAGLSHRVAVRIGIEDVGKGDQAVPWPR